MTPTISIVLPALDEAANIERVLDDATRVAERLCPGHELIVVDDGSTDDTAAIVRRRATDDPRIRLVQHARNRGYGEALRSGFTAAVMDAVFFTDADNQFVLDELEVFLPLLEHVPVVVGYRMNRQDRRVRRLFAHGWNVLVRVLFYVPARDIDCAFKLFRRDVLEELDLQAVGAMVNTELMVKIGRSGIGILEVGVTHLPRTAGTARGAHPRVIGRALVELVRMHGRLRATGHPRTTR
jgi:glycosyltransferase involved in cell wall biosynthesis